VVSGSDLIAEVWVDAQSQVNEGNESNNRATQNLIRPPCQPSASRLPAVSSLTKPLTTLEGHTQDVLSVAFSRTRPGGFRSVDNTLRLWLV